MNVWITVLLFSSWDNCIADMYDKYGIQKQDAYAFCMESTAPPEPPSQLAPETSLRPKARPGK